MSATAELVRREAPMYTAAALVGTRREAPMYAAAAPVAAESPNGRASPRDRPGHPGVRYLRGATALATSAATISSGFFLAVFAKSSTIMS